MYIRKTDILVRLFNIPLDTYATVILEINCPLFFLSGEIREDYGRKKHVEF